MFLGDDLLRSGPERVPQIRVKLIGSESQVPIEKYSWTDEGGLLAGANGREGAMNGADGIENPEP